MQTSDMFLVYRDAKGILHTQHWSDLMEVGTLIDPDTEDVLELIGWTTSSMGGE